MSKHSAVARNIIALTLSATFLAGCGSLFNSPRQSVDLSGPYPTLAPLPDVPMPLMDRETKTRLRTDLSAGIQQSQQAQDQLIAAAGNLTTPSGPTPAVGPGAPQIQNIPASGSIEQLQSRANADNQTANQARSRVVPASSRADIERLEQATVAAVNAQRQRAIQEQRARQEAQQRALAQRQQAQQAQVQAAQQAQQAAIAQQREAQQRFREEQIAKLTNIPEPKSNADLFFDKSLEAVAIVYFNEGSTNVNESDFAVIAEAAQLLRAEGGKLKLVGHASPPADGAITQANRESNIRVSRARVEAVARQLVRVGIPIGQIELSAAADTQPVFSIKSARGQSGNRRVEIYRLPPNEEG